MPAHLSSLAASGVKSRWLTDPEPAHDNNGAPHAINTRAARPGASGDLTSESDDEGRSGSLPPSPRSMLNKTYNMLQECRGVDEFEKISRISEGTYGVVYKVSRLCTLVAVSVFSFEPFDGDEYWRWAKRACIGMAWCARWDLIRRSFICSVGWKADRLGAS